MQHRRDVREERKGKEGRKERKKQGTWNKSTLALLARIRLYSLRKARSCEFRAFALKIRAHPSGICGRSSQPASLVSALSIIVILISLLLLRLLGYVCSHDTNNSATVKQHRGGVTIEVFHRRDS